MFKKIFAFPTFIFITSCAILGPSSFETLSSREGSLRSRTDYNSYLALEYLQFARNLMIGNSKYDAQYFSKKGLAASANLEVVPENPAKWDADKVQMEELVAMQKRMEILLTPQMQRDMPIQMAHLFYLYDCWASKESKMIFRASDLSKCRENFYKLLGELEYYVEDLKKDKQPKTIIIEPKFERFEILFDLNSDKFNDKANKDFLEIINKLTALQDGYKLLLVGNADRIGKELYNKNLALKRVGTVKNYLVKNGVSEDLIATKSLGEIVPDILTKDGSQQQHNRTVAIYILTGAESFSAFPLPLIENAVYVKDIKKARAERGLSN